MRTQRLISTLRSASLLLGALALPSCSTLNSVKQTFLGGSATATETPRLTGFIGGAVADEPRAALAAREVLATGGTAADAAVALGLTLAVTLPSRAGLGGGGACLVYSPAKSGPGAGQPEAILFLPGAGTPGAGADRPAALPLMARGLYALQARYGTQQFETLIAPAERLARFGVPVSRALADDLAAVAGPLSADPDARAIFAPNGTPLTTGATLIQPDLGATLAQLRTAGVGDLYQGQLATRFVRAARTAGGGIDPAALRDSLPTTVAPIVLPAGRDRVAFLPPPADGGLAAAAAFQALFASRADLATAQAEALAAAARWRAGNITPAAILAQPSTGSALPALPASTSFATLDRRGNAVVCAVTMNNLFGTGRIAPGTGILLAASPTAAPPPLLAAALAWNTSLGSFRAEIGGSGQEGAALAVADGLLNTLRSKRPMPAPVPAPGRANVIACARYLPGTEADCGWAVDPRGAGLAASGN